MQKIKIFKQLFVVICCLLMTTQICKADDYEPVTPKNGVYQIANYNQLAWLFDVYIENNKFKVISVELLNNIEIPEGKKWKSQSIYGKLNFEGKGNTISGLNNALFSTIDDTKSVIQNLILVVNVDKAYDFGAICNTNCGTIYKCTCKGSISVSVGTVAGICKLNYGTISYCTNNAKIYAKESPTFSYTKNIGGICAENESGAKIINCTNYGELKGDSDIGGICGSNFGEIQNCTNNSPISECYSSVGGICGSNYGEISSCSNVCSVSGKKILVEFVEVIVKKSLVVKIQLLLMEKRKLVV
ncbi:MAG: hypothetical protein MJ211_13565 [Bacteroidales bacterium]|nr:hypothetical protein [Bacteroidales bacterium]